MRKFLILLGIIVCSCNNKDTKVVYIDRNAPIDSNNAFSIRYNVDGSVKDIYINKKYFNNENIAAAKNSLNDSSFYEYATINGLKVKRRVFKHEYIKDNYSIDINNDSLFIGDTFKAFLNLGEGDIVFFIQDKEAYVVEERKSQTGRIIVLSKNVNSEGIHSFKGSLIINDLEVPFIYNYVVSKKSPS